MLVQLILLMMLKRLPNSKMVLKKRKQLVMPLQQSPIGIVTATGFSSSLGTLDNLNIAHVVYAYDMDDGNTILLENNNAIYMGNAMNDSLVNPIQCKENNVQVHLRPTKYGKDETQPCQCIIFEDDLKLPIVYKDALPFLDVRRPTPKELDECERIQITSPDPWHPNDFKLSIMPISKDLRATSQDRINDILQCKNLYPIVSNTRMLHE